MAEFDVPFSPPSYDVYRLDQDAVDDCEQVFACKLTDEMLNVIQAAAAARKSRVMMNVNPQGGGMISVGNHEFKFGKQSMPAPYADAVSCKPGVGFRVRGSVGTKFTIQATQNSFEETRVKAQKRLEEEKSRGTKDVNKSRSGKNSGLHGSHAVAALAHARGASLAASAPSRTLGGIRSNNASPNLSHANAAAASARMSASMRADLMKKTLRERIVHICATARYRSFDEVIGRLRKDGLPSDQDSIRLMESVLKEVSETSESGRVILKPSLHSEVNMKWPWLSTEEKTFLRRLLQPTSNSTNSSFFAPTRKSGMDRVVAPSSSAVSNPSSSSGSDRRDAREDSRSGASSAASNTSSPEAVHHQHGLNSDCDSTKHRSTPMRNTSGSSTLAPPPSSGSVGHGKKRSLSPLEELRSTEGTTIVEDDDDDSSLLYSVAPPSKRKAHAPSGNQSSVKGTERDTTASTVINNRPRQESASPPEDPTMSKEVEIRLQKQISPVRPTSTSPRTDWSVQFPPLTRGEDATVYATEFSDCYSDYVACHNSLSKIANEFTEMERELLMCMKGSGEAEQVEQRIQSKYAFYEKDASFIKLRARHDDLRSKLTMIRARLEAWEASPRSRGGRV